MDFFTLNAFLIGGSVLLGVGVFYLAYKGLGTLIGYSILPQQRDSSAPEKDMEVTNGQTLVHHPKCKSPTLTTPPDGPARDHHILCFLGNDTSVSRSNDWHNTFKNIANATEASVIGFDYPHVGMAKGSVRSEKALVDEGIAQVQRLLDAGVEPQKVTLYGHSLGGAVATLVAAHFHSQKPPQPISLINDRSFGTAADQGISILNMKNPVSKAIFKLFMNASWKMDAASAYNKIPENNKMIIVGPNDEAMNYDTVAIAGKVSASENIYIVDGEHGTPLIDLSIEKTGEKVTASINNFIDKQSVVPPNPPSLVVPQSFDNKVSIDLVAENKALLSSESKPNKKIKP